jgi:hypothetical protein
VLVSFTDEVLAESLIRVNRLAGPIVGFMYHGVRNESWNQSSHFLAASKSPTPPAWLKDEDRAAFELRLMLWAKSCRKDIHGSTYHVESFHNGVYLFGPVLILVVGHRFSILNPVYGIHTIAFQFGGDGGIGGGVSSVQTGLGRHIRALRVRCRSVEHDEMDHSGTRRHETNGMRYAMKELIIAYYVYRS